MADQQFCLRWNNHQSTLVSVFDNLLERGCLVDCTLAAEGRSLQAHKVVLSACSPYLEDLLSQHYDKHPILLLKDVKFEELQAMMDYMYRGEVNVAQEKLGHFLQAAESLQIKGLSDSGGKEPPDSGGTSVPSATKRTVKGIPVVRPSSVESRKQVNQEVLLDGSSQDGSISPNIRKRRRRGASLADESDMNNTAGNAPPSHAAPVAAAPAATPSAPSKVTLPLVPASEASDPTLGLLSTLMESSQTENHDSNSSSRDNVINQQHESTTEILLEPKTEYLDDEQDLTLEDDMDNSLYKPGTSGRQSGFEGMNDSNDYTEDSAREPQELNFLIQSNDFSRDQNGEKRERLLWCKVCNKPFRHRSSLQIHERFHSGEKPFQCSFCESRFCSKSDLKRHSLVHTQEKRFACSVCGRRFSRSDRLNKHLNLHAQRGQPLTWSDDQSF